MAHRGACTRARAAVLRAALELHVPLLAAARSGDLAAVERALSSLGGDAARVRAALTHGADDGRSAAEVRPR